MRFLSYIFFFLSIAVIGCEKEEDKPEAKACTLEYIDPLAVSFEGLTEAELATLSVNLIKSDQQQFELTRQNDAFLSGPISNGTYKLTVALEDKILNEQEINVAVSRCPYANLVSVQYSCVNSNNEISCSDPTITQ